MVTINELHRYGRTKLIMPGTSACPGCPLQLGMRYLAMALDAGSQWSYRQAAQA